MTVTETINLAATARTLTQEAARSGDDWGFFQQDPAYGAYLRALEEAHDVAAFRDFVVQPKDFEPQHVLFPALKRLAALVEPDAHLYLLVHRLAEWVGTV